MAKAAKKGSNEALGRKLGLNPPYSSEEKEAFKNFHFNDFLIFDETTRILHAAGDVAVYLNGPNLQFGLPIGRLRRGGEPKPSKEPDAPGTEQEAERRFDEEGLFLIWNPNTGYLDNSHEIDVDFNGPFLMFILPKRRKTR